MNLASHASFMSHHFISPGYLCSETFDYFLLQKKLVLKWTRWRTRQSLDTKLDTREKSQSRSSACWPSRKNSICLAWQKMCEAQLMSRPHVPTSPRPHVKGATSDLIWWKPSLQREVLTNGSTPFLMLAGDVGTQIVSSSFLVGNGVQIIDFHLSKDGVVLMYALAGSGVLGFLAVSAASLSDGSFLQYFIAGGFFVSEALVE